MKSKIESYLHTYLNRYVIKLTILPLPTLLDTYLCGESLTKFGCALRRSFTCGISTTFFTHLKFANFVDQDHDEQLWAADFVEESSSFAVMVLLSSTMRVRSDRIEYFVICRSLLTRSLCAPPLLEHKFPYQY